MVGDWNKGMMIRTMGIDMNVTAVAGAASFIGCGGVYMFKDVE